MKAKNDQYGSSIMSDIPVAVDETSPYIFSVMLRSLTPSYLDRPGSGYFGFEPLDSAFLMIGRNHNHQRGSTVLTRDLNLGDSFMYVNSVHDWFQDTSFNSVHMRFLVFPNDHPHYSVPYEYSRIEMYYDGTNITYTGTDYKVPIVNKSNTPTTADDIAGYNTTAGTPIGQTSAGKTYQYILGDNILIPYDWTLYKNQITGRGTDDANTFRYGTKYVRFLALLNHAYRNETSGVAAEFLMDNFMMLKVSGNKVYNDNTFTRTVV